MSRMLAIGFNGCRDGVSWLAIRRFRRLTLGLFGLVAIALLLLALVPARAHAQSGTYWLPQSGNFSDNSNWSAGSPYFYQNAYIDNGGTAIADQTGADAHSLYLGDSNGSGTITQSAGTASIFLLGLGFGGNGTYNLNGGVLSVAEVENGSGAAFNFGGGVFQCNYSPYDNISTNMPVTLTGGSATVDVENWASVNFSGNFSGSGSLTKIGSGILGLYGSVNYNGNIQVDTGWFNLAGSGQVTSTSQYVGDSGMATFTQSSATNTASQLALGYGASDSGTYNLTGGICVASTVNVGLAGTGVFTQSSGSAQFTSLLRRYLFDGQWHL